MGKLNRAVLAVGYTGKDAHHGVHLAVVLLRDAVQRDQRVKDSNVDLVSRDFLLDALDQAGVYPEVTVALGHTQGHLVPTGHEEPPLQLRLRDVVVQADGAQPPV